MNMFSQLHKKIYAKKVDSGTTRAKRSLVWGFTMIETLVAIAVLLLAVAGPLTLAAQGLISARFAKDQIIAFYLAQEAVEIIRNQRDDNALATGDVDWMSGLGNPEGSVCFSENGCRIDALGHVSECSTQGCQPLDRHDETGFYAYDPSGVGTYVVSPFTRTVKLRELNDREVRAEITIGWSNGPISRSFIVQENFLDWQ